MSKLQVLLDPEKYYHVFNHANGDENIFRKNDNYLFFLKKYDQYITQIADTFAYCLLPNHFHFVIKIKGEKELSEFFKEKLLKRKRTLQEFQTLGGFGVEFETLGELKRLISLQFSHLFNSYSQALNKQQNRKGSLFRQNFKRKLIASEEYLRELIHYVHYNPVHHGFVDDIRDWEFSSYESFFSDKATKLKRNEVIELFEDVDNFYYFHQKEIDENLAFELEF